jgi:hypothetical protein
VFRFLSSLYILDINPLSDEYWQIFSLILAIFSFDVH